MATDIPKDITQLPQRAQFIDDDILYLVGDSGVNDYHGTFKQLKEDVVEQAPVATVIEPSGDGTGVADRQAINLALTENNHAHLAEGSFVINGPINVTGERRLSGIGKGTLISHVDDTTPLVAVSGNHSIISDLRLYGGTHGIEIINSNRTQMNRLWIANCSQHGIYGHGNTWTNWISQVTVGSVGQDGVNFVNVSGESNGNNLMIWGLDAVTCGRHGINWRGNGLSVLGSHLEDNVDSGVYVSSNDTDGNANSVTIVGNYFENNQVSGITFEAAGAADSIEGIVIKGNRMQVTAGVAKLMRCLGRISSVRQLYMDASNGLTAPTTPYLEIGDTCVRSTIEVVSKDWEDVSNRKSNYVTSLLARGVRVEHLADANNDTGILYWSTDRNKLVYKDENDTLHEINSVEITP